MEEAKIHFSDYAQFATIMSSMQHIVSTSVAIEQSQLKKKTQA